MAFQALSGGRILTVESDGLARMWAWGSGDATHPEGFAHERDVELTRGHRLQTIYFALECYCVYVSDVSLELLHCCPPSTATMEASSAALSRRSEE